MMNEDNKYILNKSTLACGTDIVLLISMNLLLRLVFLCFDECLAGLFLTQNSETARDCLIDANDSRGMFGNRKSPKRQVIGSIASKFKTRLPSPNID